MILLAISVVYIFRDYGITYGCVIITSGFKSPSQLDSTIARLESETAERCKDPFVIDLSELNKEVENKSKTVSEINGIKFFLGIVVPEKKDDDSIIDKDEHTAPLKESANEKPVQAQVIESIEDSDVAVYLIKGDVPEVFSVDEVEDTAVSIQSAVKKVDLIVTSNVPVSLSKIIKSSAQLVNITKDTKSVVFTYSVIRQDGGEKVVTLLSKDVLATLF
jgi:hypothetical protein